MVDEHYNQGPAIASNMYKQAKREQQASKVAQHQDQLKCNIIQIMA